jgi:hypothetical protein
MGQPGATSADPRRRARPDGAIAAALEEDVVSPRGSKSFALPDAIVSLRSCPRDQARLGQDWKGAGSIGRWHGTSTMVRAAGAWTSSTAVLGRWPTDRVVRSSQGLCYGHWPRGQFGAFPLGIRGTRPAGVQAEVRPGSQRDRFRSRCTTKSPQQTCQPMNELELDH